MTLGTALLSCTMLGFQHGIDWDHVAAISDVTSVQRNTQSAARCGLFYAAGHAATVSVLGIVAILLGQSIPSVFYLWMERVVGLSLVVMGVYVSVSVFSERGPVTRGEAILSLLDRFSAGKRNTAGAVREHISKSSLGLGVLHGIGAETPTQLSMLVITTSLGGLQNGILGITVFTTAMFASNLVLTTAASGFFSASRVSPAVFRGLGVLTSAYSLWIGIELMR